MSYSQFEACSAGHSLKQAQRADAPMEGFSSWRQLKAERFEVSVVVVSCMCRGGDDCAWEGGGWR